MGASFASSKAQPCWTVSFRNDLNTFFPNKKYLCLFYFAEITYEISVKTGDIRHAGTDANVFLKIFGSLGDTGNLQLKATDSSINKFERGRTDVFRIEAQDIGDVRLTDDAFFSSVSFISYLAHKLVESVSSTTSPRSKRYAYRTTERELVLVGSWMKSEFWSQITAKTFFSRLAVGWTRMRQTASWRLNLNLHLCRMSRKVRFDFSNFLKIPVLCIVLSLVMVLKIVDLSFSSGKGTNNSLVVVLASGWSRRVVRWEDNLVLFAVFMCTFQNGIISPKYITYPYDERTLAH